MFGLQASKIKQLTSGIPGMDWMAGLFGDCDAALEHNGPVALNGPTSIGDKLMDRDGNIIIDGSRGLVASVTNLTGGPFPTAVILTLFREGTLAGDLTFDTTATLNLFDPNTDAVYSPNQTITVDGFYVQQTPALKIPSGTRVGAHWNGICWRVIVSAKCMVPV